MFDQTGTNYDLEGKIYEPIVAQELAKNGYETTALDFRENDPQQKLNFKTLKTNFLETTEFNQIGSNYDAVIFLRSWDTPEILTYFQPEFNFLDINKLSLKIAHHLLPKFKKLITKEGFLIVSEIFNFGLCENLKEVENYKQLTFDIFSKYRLGVVQVCEGLYFLEKLGEF